MAITVNQKFLKPSDVAEELLVHKKTIHRMIQRGELKAVRWAGGRKSEYRIYREAFELWLRQHEVKAPGNQRNA
jgi:excisionase family DNA binding protein